MRKRLKVVCEPTIVVYEGETDDMWGMTDDEYFEFWERAEDFTLVFVCKDGTQEEIPMKFTDYGNGHKSLAPEDYDWKHNIWYPAADPSEEVPPINACVIN